MPWDPDCYHKFRSERFAPFEDLMALINVRERLRALYPPGPLFYGFRRTLFAATRAR